MLKYLTTALFAAAVAAAPLAAQAHGDWHGGDWHGGMDILHGINLTDTQRQQVHQIFAGDMQQMHTVRTQMHALHDQMTSALLGGQSSAQLTALLQQEETLRDQMDAQHLALEVQVRGVLTPDQLSQAAATVAKLEALHQQERAVSGHGGDDTP